MKKLVYFIVLFFFTSTHAQKVGIGTTNPDVPLTIQADTNQNVLSFKNNSGSTRWHWSVPSGVNLMLSESGISDNRLIITEGGNIGISIASPQYRLHVNGSGYFSSSMTALNGYCTNSLGVGAVNTGLKLNVYDALANRNIAKFHNAGGFGQILVSNATITSELGADPSRGYVGTSSSHDFSVRTGGVDVIRVQNGTHHVGVGTNIPSAMLHVYEDEPNKDIANFYNTGGFGQISVYNGLIGSDLGADQLKGYVGSITDHDFIIRSGGDDAIMIKHGTRNVGIGTNTPSAKLHVNGDTRIDGTLQVTQQPALNNVTFYSPDFSNWGSPYENVTYYKDAEGRVHLSGVVAITGSQHGAMFILPAGYRPAGDLPFTCMTLGGAHRVNVNSTGHVTISLPDVSDWVSVSGISFRAQ